MRPFASFGIALAVAGLFTAALHAQAPQPAPQPAPTQVGTTIQGQIIKMQAPDQFVVRTLDNKEYILYTNPQTRYLLNNKAAQYGDLRVGSNVTTVYGVRDNRNYVNTVTIGQAVPAPAPQPVPVPAQPAPVQPAPGQPTIVEGTVVRIVGQDQVILKTADNKEVTVYVMPQTKYLINEQPVQFSEFQAGTPVRVEYDAVGQRWNARRLLGRLRNR